MATRWRGWGLNTLGITGTASGTPVSGGPIPFNCTVDFVEVSASGLPHAIGRTADGNVYTWGANNTYVLGLGDLIARTSPTLVTDTNIAGRAVQVAAAGQSSLVLRDDGTVWVVGNNTVGEWGTGSSGEIFSAWTQMTWLPAMTVAKIVGGPQAVAIIDSTGKLWYAGYNNAGSAGDGTTGAAKTTFGNYSGLTNVTDVAFAPFGVTVLALLVTGGVRTWGYNTGGACGIGTTAACTTPQTPTGVSGVTSIAGLQDGFLVVAGGVVKGWGEDFDGELATGVDLDTINSTPFAVSYGGPTPSKVFGGPGALVGWVLDSAGGLWGSGANFRHLQLTGTTADQAPYGQRWASFGAWEQVVTIADDSVLGRLAPPAVGGFAFAAFIG